MVKIDNIREMPFTTGLRSSWEGNGTEQVITQFEQSQGIQIPWYNREELERLINVSLSTNSWLKFESEIDGLNYVKTPQEMIEIMRIRSLAYRLVGNDVELGDKVPGLNYDKYDFGKSLIFSYRNENEEIVGTTRLILDSELGLFSEEKFDPIKGFQDIREMEFNRGKRIGELSRSCILPEYQRGDCFKKLMRGIYEAAEEFNVGTIMTTVRSRDRGLCEKMGMKAIKNIDYGEIKDCWVLSWQIPDNTSEMFRRKILKRKDN